MIEITIRRFYTCDEGMDLVPSRTFTAPDDLSEPLDVAKIAKTLEGDLEDFPAANVRLMTKEEAESYREREKREREEAYADIEVD